MESAAPLISATRSIVVAADVGSLEEFERQVVQTAAGTGVGAYKIGLSLVLRYGLGCVVRTARAHTDRPLIYDHQKGGTDIPQMAPNFAAVCRSAGVDAVILFPLSGPETARRWIAASQEVGLRVLVGGHMTHKAFLHSEGGFVIDSAPRAILELASDMGVVDFVVPGNKIALIDEAKQLLEKKGVRYTFYAPGFITQGGDITECARAAGERWHAIVGSAIYSAPNPQEAVAQLSRLLTQGGK